MTIINHETYCGQDLIALLLKAGFDWKDYFVAHSIDEHFHWEIPLHIAQRWLREVKRIFITVSVYEVIEQGLEITDSDKFSVYAETWDSQSEFWNKWTSLFEIYDFNTYEETQEAGIKKALEIILEKGE